MAPVAEFETRRGRMFGLAYRLLGSAVEAEDAVQDAYLRWDRADRTAIGSPDAWLAKVVTNLCLNRLTSARARREQYVGPWLPEPVFTPDGALGPLETVEQRDSLSLGVLMLLERLTPPERAAFVLREAFDYSHRDIAEILDVEDSHARQLYRRAREHVGEPRKRFTASVVQRAKIVEKFLAATLEGDVASLERMLAEDVVAWSDGGGKATAARRPVFGQVGVARLFSGLPRVPRAARARFSIELVNGDPAVAIYESEALTYLVVPEVADDRIVAFRTIANPDKLAFAAQQRK